MTTIPHSWHPKSRRIAAEYRTAFEERYQLWRGHFADGTVECYFIRHVAELVWNGAEEEPANALALYRESRNLWEHLMSIDARHAVKQRRSPMYDGYVPAKLARIDQQMAKVQKA